MANMTAAQRLLVARAILGDERAFELLVREYTSRLVWFVRKLGLSEPASEDVVQDAWVAAWTSLAKLRDLGAFRSWLYGITRNKALQHMKLLREMPAGELDAPAHEEVSETYFDRYLHKLDRALDEIPVMHREVLTLRFFEGMSYIELARALGVTAGTVKSRLHYAKIALRRKLDGIPNE